MTEAEWQTRKQRIDTKLAALNPAWKVIPFKIGLDTSALTAHAVTEFPTGNGPADYALFVKGKFLGILEAKKVAVGAQNVLEQAKRYSKGAFQGSGNWDGYRVPFLYSSNGERIWYVDVRDNKSASRELSAFHTPDAISEMFEKNRQKSLQTLLLDPAEIKKARDYQKAAIQAVESAVVKGKRAMLVAMATGTGKTFTTVALIYRLLRAKVVRRVLFLVDRRALAAQAVREFAAFNTPTGSKFNLEYEVFSQKFHKEDFDDDKPFDPKVLPGAYLTNPGSAHTFVYVSTIQRMTINLYGRENTPKQKPDDPDYDDDAEKIDIPIHAFDLIIADECHRGYTAKETAIWRDVMNYFDAIKIGLTATPAAHSLSLFKEVVFRFTTDQAIQVGCLVDYDAVRIKSGVRMKGVFLKEGEYVGIVDTETGEETYDELEDERHFGTDDLEKRITAPDSNKKIVREIARYAYEHQSEKGVFRRYSSLP